MNAAPAAGFWIRALALVVDLAVIMIAQLTFEAAARLLLGFDAERSWAVAGLESFCTLLFAVLYATVLHSTGGQTVGKALTRVRVVGLDGEPPPAGAALLRCLAYVVSAAPFALGFVMAGLRADKRALHDLIAGTRVERLPRTRRHRQAPAERDGDGDTMPGSACDPAPTAPAPPRGDAAPGA